MKSKIKTMAILGLVFICLFAMPAHSMPAGNGASKSNCNISDKNCNAWAGGMGNPEMAMHKMCSAEMNNWKNASWNKTGEIEIYQAGKGFAIGDNQNHLLYMNIEGKMNPDPAEIQKLISDNKTIAQIKSDIKAKMDTQISATSYNGSLRLGESNYNLASIKVALSKDNSTTIEADVVGPKVNPEDKPTTIVGHITVTASRKENSTIGEGTLTISAGQNSGKYKVLIEMGHAKGMFDRMGAPAFDGMNRKGERFGMNTRMHQFMPMMA